MPHPHTPKGKARIVRLLQQPLTEAPALPNRPPPKKKAKLRANLPMVNAGESILPLPQHHLLHQPLPSPARGGARIMSACWRSGKLTCAPTSNTTWFLPKRKPKISSRSSNLAAKRHRTGCWHNKRWRTLSCCRLVPKQRRARNGSPHSKIKKNNL